MKASITIDGKTYKIDASHYDTVDVKNGYVTFWKKGYGTTSVKIVEKGEENGKQNTFAEDYKADR